ncbi:HNH endonuclease [Polaromonas sp. P1(28)-8]|nr:HNH endonuclease [Polaromonas sp. P1(28)-8]
MLQNPEGYAGYLAAGSLGLDQRIDQLESIWAGDIAAYTVMANAHNPNIFELKIKDYHDDNIFAITQLELREDGAILARLSDKLVSVAQFPEHSKTHRTSAGVGPLPIDSSIRTGLMRAGHQAKISALRAWLVETCQRRSFITYTELMTRFGLAYFPMLAAMGAIGRDCQEQGLPILTAVIVDKDTRRCSEGLRGLGVEDDEAERERCYAYWAIQPADTAVQASPIVPGQLNCSDLTERAKRFAQVEVRPDQAKFRDAVFLACEGRCVVSGCDVPEALEAAHLSGREWRNGQNAASDGVLLRRDLHALYDRGLLVLLEGGGVSLDPRVTTHYGELLSLPVVSD